MKTALRPPSSSLRLLLVGAVLVSMTSCRRSEESKPPSPQAAQGSAEEGKPIPAPPDVAAPPADAERTSSGLASKVLRPGTGTEKPQVQDKVRVHYTGWTTDGKMFDSSIPRGTPAEFPLRGVIRGWTEGLQLMAVGEKRRFWIPEELAYKGNPMGPQGTLVFDVELLDIIPGPKPVPAPPDVAEPPADAERTASGLATKVLQQGTENRRPGKFDRVVVNYTGWTTDGVMFDSSVTRGTPAVFGLNQVIPGWSEGLQLMRVGEKRRLWIPEALAYGGQPGKPLGMLVFDVELLNIHSAPPAPSDVAAVPKNATRTPSGLASRVLQAGTGKTKPGPTSKVVVHYTGWTTDGAPFDSSHLRGEPLELRLNQVIPGWTEGVQLMVEGEKRRLWIPEELAYKGAPGAPQGMLVFDVELIRISE